MRPVRGIYPSMPRPARLRVSGLSGRREPTGYARRFPRNGFNPSSFAASQGCLNPPQLMGDMWGYVVTPLAERCGPSLSC